MDQTGTVMATAKEVKFRPLIKSDRVVFKEGEQFILKGVLFRVSYINESKQRITLEPVQK